MALFHENYKLLIVFLMFVFSKHKPQTVKMMIFRSWEQNLISDEISDPSRSALDPLMMEWEQLEEGKHTELREILIFHSSKCFVAAQTRHLLIKCFNVFFFSLSASHRIFPPLAVIKSEFII